MFQKICVFLCISLFCMCLFGCSEEKATAEKLRDLDFTVVATENIPDELIGVLEEKKATPFYQAYSDGDFMYLCVGYGEQATGGYSITVDELYLTNANVCMSTTLIGPGAAEERLESPSYPYVVVCTESIDKPVLFE